MTCSRLGGGSIWKCIALLCFVSLTVLLITDTGRVFSRQNVTVLEEIIELRSFECCAMKGHFLC